MTVFIAFDSRRLNFENLKFSTYFLNLTFQNQLEITKLSFVDKHFLLFFENKITMFIEQIKTFLNNVKNVNDATSQQSFANITKMFFKPIASFISSTVSNQNTLNQCFVSNFQLFELNLRVDQFIKEKLVSKKMNCVFSDFENELYTVECASNDQISCKSKTFKFFVFIYAI